MFIENSSDAKKLINLLDIHDSIINVYYTSTHLHPSNNTLLAVFVQVQNKNYVISFNHPDVENISPTFLKLILNTRGRKIIFDRKKLLYFSDCITNSVDAMLGKYFIHKKETDHEFKIKPTIQNLKCVPIMVLLKHFKNVCKSVSDLKFDEKLLKYEQDFSSALFGIEKNGLMVENLNKGDLSLLVNNTIFSNYNMMTPTGRPSNAFGNINFAALNKKTGDRDCFVSRYGEDGLLIMVDYESYHLRLLGNFLKYDLPSTSLHEYLGELYHGKKNLTEEEYEFSKKVTFNLIYGGITDDVKNNVPFMKEISNYVDDIWKFYSQHNYVETWFYKRKIHSNFFEGKLNSYKVFNYLLQSAETEKNCEIIIKLNEYLNGKMSKLILYTYDAFLFDFHKSEFPFIKELLPIITSNNLFPVRTYMGRNYGNMKQL